MRDTTFSLVVRGDALFSYRLLEVMSAGVIPVIFSDNWVLPFEEIINWDKFSIRINESEWSTTVTRLRSIPEKDVILMRKRVFGVYKTYFINFTAQVTAVLKLLSKRKQNHTL